MADDSPKPAREPTAREAYFFLEILGNMKNAPDVDWDAVAAKCNYSNAGCAKVRFGQIKRALGWTSGGSGPAPAPKVKATPNKINKKEKAPKAPKTPTPTKAKKTEVKEEDLVANDEEEEDDDDELQRQLKDEMNAGYFEDGAEEDTFYDPGRGPMKHSKGNYTGY